MTINIKNADVSDSLIGSNKANKLLYENNAIIKIK